MVKNRTFWGVLGTMLSVIGLLLTINFALRQSSLVSGFISGLMALAGILIIAWAFGE